MKLKTFGSSTLVDTWDFIKSTNFQLVSFDHANAVYLGWNTDTITKGNCESELGRIIVIQMATNSDGGQYDNNLRIEGEIENFIKDYNVKAIYRLPIEHFDQFNMVRAASTQIH